jgi:hypothetical protein
MRMRSSVITAMAPGGDVVGEIVEVFEGEVELLPGRLIVEVELD